MSLTITNEDNIQMMKSINNNSIDLLLTDPPFGMDFQSNHRKNKHEKIQNDTNLYWFPEWIKEMCELLNNDCKDTYTIQKTTYFQGLTNQINTMIRKCFNPEM